MVTSQAAWSMEDRQGATAVAVYPYLGLDVVCSVPIGGDLQDQPLEVHAVIVGHGALELLAQDLLEMAADERYKGAAGLGGDYGKLGIESGPIAPLKIAVGCGDVGDCGQGQLLG